MEFCDAGTLKQLLVIELHEQQIAYIIHQVSPRFFRGH